MTWSTWGVPGALATLAAWGAALAVYRTCPARKVNRRLAALLVLEGLWVTGSVGALFFLDRPEVVHVVSVIGVAALTALPFVYVGFLGTALDTPLVRPFSSDRAFLVLSLAGAVAGGAVLLRPDVFVGPPYAAGWAPWNFQVVGLGQSAVQLQGAVHLYALLAAISAYVQTHSCDGMRRQAFWFAVAFGVRDVYVGITQILYPVARPLEFWGDLVYNPGLGIVFLIYVVLLSYGVLQAQLFDIEVRVRVALERSTVVAAVAGAFFVGSEILESVIPVDGVVLGILTAGVIVLLLRPVQRTVEKLIRKLVPAPEPTADDLEIRKFEVYRAALEAAARDGIITEREREVLSSLRSELGISEGDAARMQREVTIAVA